jgi:hypothetical protein
VNISEAGRPPRVGEILALLVIVPAVAAAARSLAPAIGPVTPRLSAIYVGLFAALVGVPALAFLTERGRFGVSALAAMGLVAGAIPPLLLALSGAVGFFVLGGSEYAWWALERGISIPLYGPIGWPRFLRLLGWCVSVGLASGVIYALLVPAGRWKQPLAWVLTALTLALAVGLGAVTK